MSGATAIFSRRLHVSKIASRYGVVSPIVRIHRSSSQGVEMEMRIITV